MKNDIISIIEFLMDICPKTLIKEIKDSNGKVYFRRYSYINTPIFSVVEHKFFQDLDDEIFDKDGPLHSHPNEFLSIIIEGGYEEEYLENHTPNVPHKFRINKRGDVNFISKNILHKIKGILKTTLVDNRAYCRTLCINIGRRKPWGYFVMDVDNKWKIIDNDTFRSNKSKYKVE